MRPDDRRLLERWLALIARLRERGCVTEHQTAELRREALEAVA